MNKMHETRDSAFIASISAREAAISIEISLSASGTNC